MGLILIAITLTFLIPLLLGAPIALALGGTGLLWLVLADPHYLAGAAYAVWNTFSSDDLSAVPLFILMGEIIQRSELAHRFYKALGRFVAWLPGGLLHANIGVCAIFAAISGSSVATAATVGTTAISSMRRLGYPKELTLGTLAAGGTLGILIPPSVPLIIYGTLVEQSVGKLFLAGFLPGFLIAGLFSLYVVLRSVFLGFRPLAVAQEHVAVSRLHAILDMLPFLFISAVVLGGLYFGWTTPTEAAALGVLIAVIVSLAYRRCSVRLLLDSFISSTRFTGMLVFLIASAQVFAFAIFSWNINSWIADFVSSLAYPPFVILGFIVVIYLILGMFVDTISAMVMSVAAITPIVQHIGYDLIWFGIILVILLEIGLITPPVGMNLFTIKGIDPDNPSIGLLSRAAFPFVVIMLLAIALFTAFPEIVLWLPQNM